MLDDCSSLSLCASQVRHMTYLLNPMYLASLLGCRLFMSIIDLLPCIQLLCQNLHRQHLRIHLDPIVCLESYVLDDFLLPVNTGSLAHLGCHHSGGLALAAPGEVPSALSCQGRCSQGRPCDGEQQKIGLKIQSPPCHGLEFPWTLPPPV